MPLDAGSPPLVAAVRGLGAALREVGYPAAAQHPRDMTRQWRPGVASYDADRIAELGATALGVVVTAFELQRPVPRAALEAALPGVDLDALLAGGFLEPAGPDAVRTTIGIQACDGVLALADDHYAEFDAVLRVSASTLALAYLTPHRTGGRLLDLGTGGGFLALLAARHGMHAVGVDIGERAIAVAGMAAALTDVADVEWRLGDWFAPVAGERFDLVVANPPFVISSRSEFLFRDSGRPPGELVRALVRTAPDHLARGGIAIVSGEWPVGDGEPWSDPVRAWTEGLGCDVVALAFDTATPEEHAAHWVSGADVDDLVERRDEWTRHLRDHGASVVYGTLVLRAADGRDGGFAPVVCAGTPREPSGAWVVDLLDAVAREATAAGEPLNGTYAVADGVRVDQPFARAEGRWRAGQSKVRPKGSLPVSVQVRPGVLDVLLALDGSTSLAATIERVADRRGHDREVLAGAVLAVLPDLLATALVRRATMGTDDIPTT